MIIISIKLHQKSLNLYVQESRYTLFSFGAIYIQIKIAFIKTLKTIERENTARPLTNLYSMQYLKLWNKNDTTNF